MTKEAAQLIARSLGALSSSTLNHLSLHFNVNGITLGPDFSEALAESLSECSKLAILELDMGGYSLKSNEIRDKGINVLLI
jgi:hypothetical protein